MSLQEFATANEEMTHHAIPALPEDQVCMEADHAFVDGMSLRHKMTAGRRNDAHRGPHVGGRKASCRSLLRLRKMSVRSL
jgi:hypothetical protein